MDCDYPASGQDFVRGERKRKRMDPAPEDPELQPRETRVKRRRTETGEKDARPGKTETCVEASCADPGGDRKENALKRKRTNIPQGGPVPQPKVKAKRRRRMGNGQACFDRSYILGKLLGEGAYASVYEGVRKSDRKKVALKFMSREVTGQYITLPGDTRRLPVEVALMELVCKPSQCPYVIELVEWFKTPEHVILVLERPEPCVDLFKHCVDVDMTESHARIIMQQVVQAAHHCHARGVFHRDIKEENILLNPETLDVKLIDFGCGDLVKDTPYTEFEGTMEFAPPEWLTDKEYVAEPTTVWGLGVLLYSLLCEKEPFPEGKGVDKAQLQFPSHLSDDSLQKKKRSTQA